LPERILGTCAHQGCSGRGPRPDRSHIVFPQAFFSLGAESLPYGRAAVRRCPQYMRGPDDGEQAWHPMRFHADLHVHSKYSRATSRDLDLEHLAAWAARKGIGVVATGDFTHPAWRAELAEKLVPAEPGLYRLRSEIEQAVLATLPAPCRTPVRFMLEVEISTIYKKGDRTRKIHHLIYAPDLETVDRMSARLARIGNIASDGRPILGLDSRNLLEIALESGPHAYLVPAHIWTPWFAALGSQSGFDSIADCYGDLADHIGSRPIPTPILPASSAARRRPSTATSTTSPSRPLWRAAAAMWARSNFFRTRANITSMAIANARCGSVRRRRSRMAGAARSAAGR
jgi:hypothetical protein